MGIRSSQDDRVFENRETAPSSINLRPKAVEAYLEVPLGLGALAPAIYTSDAKDPATDLASGALMPLVYVGAPFATSRGTYSDTYVYQVGDSVFYPGTATYYRLMQTAPAGTKPDRPYLTADGSLQVPWAPVSIPTYEAIRIRVDGLPAAGARVMARMQDRFATFRGKLPAGGTHQARDRRLS